MPIMKKCLKVILYFICFVGVPVIILGLCISYITNYKKVTVDTTNAPDGQYKLLLQSVGEPDWPFGSASGRLILKKNEDTISQTGFELRNDGGSVNDSCWKVTWYETYVKVILSGKEQPDERITLCFDGSVDR